MKVKQITMTDLLVLGVISLLLPAFAQAGDADKIEGFGTQPIAKLITGSLGRLLVLKSELGITGTQKAEIQAIVKRSMGEMVPSLRSVVDRKRKLRDAVLADHPDEGAIRAAANDLGKSIGDIAVKASKVVLEARKQLTKEQIDKLTKFRSDQDAGVDRWLADIGK